MSTHPVKRFAPASLPHIARLRELCLALPEVEEQLAWGAPTWRIGGRLFAQLADHHHGNPHCAVWLAAPDGAQQALIEAEPTRFFRPAYVGHRGWVAAVLDEQTSWPMLAAVVEQAYQEISARRPAPRRAAAKPKRPAAARTPVKAVRTPVKAVRTPVKAARPAAKAGMSAVTATRPAVKAARVAAAKPGRVKPAAKRR